MIPHYNFLRKAPADFGWDWGPTFAPAGIYGGAVLVGYDSVYITGKGSTMLKLSCMTFANCSMFLPALVSVHHIPGTHRVRSESHLQLMNLMQLTNLPAVLANVAHTAECDC